MAQVFQNIPPKGKLLIIILLIASVFLLLTYWTSGLTLTLILSGVISFILFLTKTIWLSDDHGKNMLRHASLGIILLLSGTYGFWNAYTSAIVTQIIKQYFPNIQIPQNAPSASILVFAFAVIAVVNYFMRDKTAMNTHSEPIDKDFPEVDFKRKLYKIAEVLDFEMRRIDNDTSWTDDDFVPLEAEVEIISNNKRKKRITDLLGAIKKNKNSKTFLIIGDPGAGKSVALRQLTKDLLKEVKVTGKLPIYVNLKEWQATHKWNKSTPPSSEEFYNFIVNSLKEIPDIFVNRFIDKYFEKMYEHGRIFFILDSFDEIPEIMDVDDSPWLIDKLSHLVFTFLNGANDSRGVLSSRFFRKPTQSFQTRTILEIRPFSELKIEQSFKSQLRNYDKNLSIELFTERSDLVPVARNPFTAALMIKYVQDTNGLLPANKSEMYASYISSRLNECESRIKDKGLKINLIKDFCKDFSYKVFDTPGLGLEITIGELKSSLPEYSIKEINDIVDILVYAKICRKSTTEKRLSFVHRRFNEYFVVNYLIQTNTKINTENIAIDSRWRDCLVLYCEIASPEDTEEIIDFCWEEISLLKDQGVLKNIQQLTRSIHCLRFLVDAFLVRKNLLFHIEEDLCSLIKNNICLNENLLLTKFSVEATGILNEKGLHECLLLAFEQGNDWISEISFKASRHLGRIDKMLEKKMTDHLISLEHIEAFKRRKEINFSLSLSNAFENIRKNFYYYIVDIAIMNLALFLSLFAGSFNVVIFGILFGFLWLESLSNFLLGFSSTKRSNLFSLRIRIAFSVILTFVVLYYYFGLTFDLTYYIKLIFPKYLLNLHDNHSDNLIVINYCIVLVISLLMFPWVEIFIFKNKFWPAFKLSRYKFMINLVAFGIVGLGVFSAKFVSKNIVINIAVLFVLCVLGGLVRFFLIPYIKDLNNFRKISRKLVNIKILERREILLYFFSLKTTDIRKKYLQLLSNYSIVASGEWPEGELKKIKFTDEEILLFKLEEKWLGFN